MKDTQAKNYRDNRLSYKLLVYILLFSTGFTLLIAVIQMAVEYRKDQQHFDSVMEQIRNSFKQPIESSLWDFDIVQIENQLKGVLSLPLVKRVEIHEVSGGRERMITAFGELAGMDYTITEFPLMYMSGLKEKRIGTLTVFAGMAEVYEKIITESVIIFCVEVLKIFLLSFFVLLIFHNLIMKHLMRVSEYLKTVDLETSLIDLQLERMPQRAPDILDRLVDSLNDIRLRLTSDIAERTRVEEQLRQINAELMANRSEIERQNQLKTGQMTFAETLRGDQSIETLAQGIISYLCRYLDAGAGIFYLVTGPENRLVPKGRYAMYSDPDPPASFRIGEGLVGQVVRNKARSVLNNLSEHYFSIHSALGEAVPTHIFIHPFILNDKVLCVVEIATFRPLKDHETLFMDSISESVAIATESAQIRQQRTHLLEEFKLQTRELSVSERALRRSEEKFKLIFNNSSQFIGLLDDEGRLLDANKTLLEFTGYASSEIEGCYFWETPFWPDDEKRETLRNMITDCIHGFETAYELELKGTDDGVARIRFAFRPVSDEAGNVSQIIVEGNLR